MVYKECTGITSVGWLRFKKLNIRYLTRALSYLYWTGMELISPDSLPYTSNGYLMQNTLSKRQFSDISLRDLRIAGGFALK
ncbi:hypothetical protein [Mucilaginibacter sp. HD30]